PVGVGEDLHLDVAGRGEQPFEEEGVVAEGAGGLPARGGERGGEVLGPHDLVHPLAAPAGGRFDQHGEAEIGGPGEEGGVVRPGRGQSGHDGYAAGGDGGAGGDLVPHRLDRFGRRADEHQARLLAGAGEVGALGEEAVAGVDGPGAGGRGGGDELGPVEVGADADGPVGGCAVGGGGVLVGVHRDPGQAEGRQGAEDPPRDLAAVGDQDAVDHVRLTSGR